MRAPISEEDLKARIATLRAKAEAHRLPHVDPHGLLRFAGRSITVSRTETDLLECLVRQFGILVRRETLLECLPERSGGVSRNALDLHIMRLRRRIQPLDLSIRTVWGRGYLLEAAGASQAGGTGSSRGRNRGDALRRARHEEPELVDGRSLAAAEVAALRWGQSQEHSAAS